MKLKAYWLNLILKVLGINFETNKVTLEDYHIKEIDVSLDDVILLYNVGLLDKNNKEIYSGDIVECLVNTDENGTPIYKAYQVIWNNDYHCWWLSDLFGTDDKYLYQFNSDEIEIVDNIYQQHLYYIIDDKFYKWSF